MFLNPIAQIKSGESKKYDESSIIKTYETFIIEYGWISLKEFNDLPIPAYLAHCEMINKRHKEQEKKLKKK